MTMARPRASSPGGPSDTLRRLRDPPPSGECVTRDTCNVTWHCDRVPGPEDNTRGGDSEEEEEPIHFQVWFWTREVRGKTLFVQAKETSAADIKLRIDGPEAASADNAVEVKNYHVQIKLHAHCIILYRMKIKSEARSAVNSTFYSLVFLSLLV